MANNRRYEKYRINPSVAARAVWAFDEYFWQKDIELPEIMKAHIKEAMDCAIRSAVNAGRTNGWFERKDMPESETQSYKVHLFSGEGDACPTRVSKYGFHAMDAGCSYRIECDDLPKLRAAATSYAKDHGFSFTVNKHDGGAIVTRNT